MRLPQTDSLQARLDEATREYAFERDRRITLEVENDQLRQRVIALEDQVARAFAQLT